MPALSLLSPIFHASSRPATAVKCQQPPAREVVAPPPARRKSAWRQIATTVTRLGSLDAGEDVNAAPRPEVGWAEAVSTATREELASGSFAESRGSSRSAHRNTTGQADQSIRTSVAEGGSSSSRVDAEAGVKEASTSTEADEPRGTVGRPPRQLHDVGALQHIPSVQPSSEILFSALRRAKHVKATKGIINASKKARSCGAQQLDALTKELTAPLARYLRGFPSRSQLHPFECAVVELTLGEGVYEERLQGIDSLRKKLLAVGKNCASLVNKTATATEAEECTAKGFASMEHLFSQHAHVVDELKEVAKRLRSLPVVHPHIPTLCLVGAPNVGKSSLVQAISSGKPEVCNYPFTTRGVIMGHFKVGDSKHQVTDTPGLLPRSDEDRNRIEKLTIAVLTHLPTSILFVHDPTEECGMTMEKQYSLYLQLHRRFGHRPWIDVVSKADIPLTDSHQPNLGPSHPSEGIVRSSPNDASAGNVAAVERSEGSPPRVSGAAAAVGYRVYKAEQGTSSARGEFRRAEASEVVQEPRGSANQRNTYVGSIEAPSPDCLQGREADSATPHTEQQGDVAQSKDDASAKETAGGWRNLSPGSQEMTPQQQTVRHAVTPEGGGEPARDALVSWEEYRRARGPPGALRVSVHTAIGMPELMARINALLSAEPEHYALID